MRLICKQQLTLIDCLAQMAPDSSKTTLRSWLKDGRVAVDGQTIKNGSTLIQAGQEVTVGAKTRTVSNLKIYYEDKHCIVIEKPSGLLSVAAAFETDKTVHSLLKDHFRPNKVFVVHRLDQDTSGIMLFALSEQAYDLFKKDFETHDIERVYIGIVEGQVFPAVGTWRSYLYEDSNYVVHSTQNSTEGRLAVTHYEAIAMNKKRTLLRITLETGRKNQIRVHCQEARFPIVGDKKYGAQTNPIKRICLHAHVLGFHHPITKKWMRFESQVPDEMLQLVPQ